ncbi:hypothetical protein GCM10020256_17590 [Streptomyces thermocoprophilus]
MLVEYRDRLLEGALPGEAEDVADGLVGGEELAELADAAVEAEGLLALAAALAETELVPDDDGQAGHQEGGLPGALVERLQGELGVLEEDLPVGPVPHARAGAGLGDLLGLAQTALGLELRVGALAAVGAGDAAPEADGVRAAVAVHLDVEPGGQGVHHGGADAVQAAGGRVGAASELAAGVQLGHDDLDAGQAGLGLDVDRDAPAVVPDLDGAVVVEDDLDVVAVAAEGLVDGVVDDLPEAVRQAAAVGRADVHARALAYGLEPFEDEQVPRGVVGTVPLCSCQQRCGRHGRFGGHAVRSSLNFRWGPGGYGRGFGHR